MLNLDMFKTPNKFRLNFSSGLIAFIYTHAEKSFAFAIVRSALETEMTFPLKLQLQGLLRTCRVLCTAILCFNDNNGIEEKRAPTRVIRDTTRNSSSVTGNHVHVLWPNYELLFYIDY